MLRTRDHSCGQSPQLVRDNNGDICCRYACVKFLPLRIDRIGADSKRVQHTWLNRHGYQIVRSRRSPPGCRLRKPGQFLSRRSGFAESLTGCGTGRLRPRLSLPKEGCFTYKLEIRLSTSGCPAQLEIRSKRTSKLIIRGELV